MKVFNFDLQFSIINSTNIDNKNKPDGNIEIDFDFLFSLYGFLYQLYERLNLNEFVREYLKEKSILSI